MQAEARHGALPPLPVVASKAALEALDAAQRAAPEDVVGAILSAVDAARAERETVANSIVALDTARKALRGAASALHADATAAHSALTAAQAATRRVATGARTDAEILETDDLSTLSSVERVRHRDLLARAAQLTPGVEPAQ